MQWRGPVHIAAFFDYNFAIYSPIKCLPSLSISDGFQHLHDNDYQSKMQLLPENAGHIILIYEHGRKVFSDFFSFIMKLNSMIKYCHPKVVIKFWHELKTEANLIRLCVNLSFNVRKNSNLKVDDATFVFDYSI